MNYLEMLDELREERDLVDHVIAVFERMQAGAPRRRGRPPGWLTERNKELVSVGGSTPPRTESGEPPVKRKRGRPRKNPDA
jgi:AT hook motif